MARKKIAKDNTKRCVSKLITMLFKHTRTQMHCTAARMVQSYLIAFSENEGMEQGICVKSSGSEWMRWRG